MPGAYRINITEEALADLNGIFDYIRRKRGQNSAATSGRDRWTDHDGVTV